MTADPLPIAVRAYAELEQGDSRRPSAKNNPSRRTDPARRPQAILVFDCESTLDASQALLFGCYRYYTLTWTASGPKLVCREEGLFHPDDLALHDPDAHHMLERYARTHTSASRSRRQLRLRARHEFVEQVLLKSLEAEATVVGFNLPFDLTRIAIAWSEARGNDYRGGFSLTLGTYTHDNGQEQEKRYWPRIRYRPLDSKRARIGLAATKPGANPDTEARRRSSFLDLRTHAYTLSGDAHTLESACQAFAVHYTKPPVELGRLTVETIDYCRGDVAATARLYQALAEEYEQHGLTRPPSRIYSPAGIAKAYLAEAGIRPPLSRQPSFPKEVLGYAMVVYYGGRAECRIRRWPVPVTYLDFRSMYPSVAVLTGLWRFLTCERIEVIENDPARVEAWLGRRRLGDAFDPRLWRKLNRLVLIQPHEDILPVRARYSRGGSYGIGINPLTSEEPLWYTLADALASTLLTGRPPKILRVIQLAPRGNATGLRPLRIRGSRPIDPYREDGFKALVEERRRLERLGDSESLRTGRTLKNVANSASYGINVELNRHEPLAKQMGVHVFGLASFESKVATIEEPGGYFFPPLAALVAGGARLMLSLLERLVTDAGGSYAFCDTDSMAVVATQAGGLIPCPGSSHRDDQGRECVRALSWAELDRVVARFATLNPYDHELVTGSILELEDENYAANGSRRELTCYTISAKRYALYTLDEDGQPVLVKPSEHALGGFYLDPTDPAEKRDWVSEAWQLMLREDALGLKPEQPDWLELPALTRFTASHPRLLHPFAQLNEGKPYQEQIKPANFLLVAHVPAGGHPPGAVPERFALAAPFDGDPRSWARLPWRSVYDRGGATYRIDTESIYEQGGAARARDAVGVRTYRDVLRDYRRHPEAKSVGASGRPCTRHTIGALSRRPVRAVSVTHVGKEANLLEEIAAGLVRESSEVLVAYRPSVDRPQHC
jgi:hypothetical protein